MTYRANFCCLITLGILGLSAINAVAAAEILTLATTTSTENSGLLAQIHPDFEKKTGARIKVIAKGTGASLQLARDGNVDVVLVHARSEEDKFVAAGYGVMRRDVMFNDFVIVGPPEDPAGIKGTRDPAKALQTLADGRHAFLSRGDGSGTHLKEQQLWRDTDLRLISAESPRPGKKSIIQVRPEGDWYLSIGQGMGKTIMMATEKQAYTLADRGTYYAFALAEPPKTDLEILVEGRRGLYNSYGVIAVNPAKHPRINFSLAKRYIRWITSAEVQRMIGAYRFQGKVLFQPYASGPKPESIETQ